MQFQNRTQAGKLLAHKILQIFPNYFDKTNTIVVALPKGGVPVAHEIAKELKLPLDILLIKKLGAPTYPELAIGAVSENDEVYYNHHLMKDLDCNPLMLENLKDQALHKLHEIGSILRLSHNPLSLAHKNIIIVDDGIDTGATMEAVIRVLKKRNVNKMFIATPVASADTLLKFDKVVEDIIVLWTPHPIYSVGEWYDDFIQVENEEISKILSQYRSDSLLSL
jgi:predicted phosphoribosyltransferase